MANALDFGARFRTVQATAGSIPFDSGNTRSLELPRSFLYRGVVLRLTGSYPANATAFTTNPENPLGLIKQIQLVADGRKILWTLSGRDAFRLAHLYRGVEGERATGFNTISVSDFFSATIVLDNAAIRMQLPADSFFDPREFEKIELRVTWGAISDIYNGAALATLAASTAIDVEVLNTTVGVEHIAFNRILQFDEQIVTGASTNFTFNVPRSGLLAGIMFRTDHSPSANSLVIPTPIDAIINFVTLKSDNSFVHADRLAWQTLKARNNLEFQFCPKIPDGTSALPVRAVAPTAPEVTLPQSNFIPGYAYLDLTEDGLMSSCLNTLAMNVLQLILDVNGTGAMTAPLVIRCTYVFFEPIRPLVAE